MIARVKQIAGDKPLIVMGDLNSEETDPGVRLLSEAFVNTRLSAEKTSGLPYSYESGGRIDHVFVSKGQWRTCSHTTLELKGKSGTPLSDHYPVVVELQL